MNRRVAGVLALAIALGGAALTRDDFRDGQSRFWLSGGVTMFTFRRAADPGLFWASTIANSALIGLLLFGGLAAMLLP